MRVQALVFPIIRWRIKKKKNEVKKRTTQLIGSPRRCWVVCSLLQELHLSSTCWPENATPIVYYSTSLKPVACFLSARKCGTYEGMGVGEGAIGRRHRRHPRNLPVERAILQGCVL